MHIQIYVTAAHKEKQRTLYVVHPDHVTLNVTVSPAQHLCVWTHRPDHYWLPQKGIDRSVLWLGCYRCPRAGWRCSGCWPVLPDSPWSRSFSSFLPRRTSGAPWPADGGRYLLVKGGGGPTDGLRVWTGLDGSDRWVCQDLWEISAPDSRRHPSSSGLGLWCVLKPLYGPLPPSNVKLWYVLWTHMNIYYYYYYFWALLHE